LSKSDLSQSHQAQTLAGNFICREESTKRLGADHFVVSKDKDAMSQVANSFDGIIDTVSADHPLPDYLVGCQIEVFFHKLDCSIVGVCARSRVLLWCMCCQLAGMKTPVRARAARVCSLWQHCRLAPSLPAEPAEA
jgi:hypothetical protein